MLSIIIPTYNSAKTIKRCLNSIIPMKHINYEILLIDDGSNDNTKSINDIYANKYHNIYSFKQQHRGVSVARNFGIKKSNGSLICFIDSDDYINPRNLEKIISKYKNTNVDLIIPNININNKILGINKSEELNSIKPFLMKMYPLYGNEIVQIIGNKIYKASIIKEHNIKFPINITMGEDFIFNLRFFKYAKEIIQTNIMYYYYYIHTYSISNKFEISPLKNRLLLLKSVKGLYNKYNLSFIAFNWLKLKASYSILLNALKFSQNISHQIYLLNLYIKKIHQNNLLPNKKYSYKTVECHILQYMINSPTLLLLLFLKLINIIRMTSIYHKL